MGATDYTELAGSPTEEVVLDSNGNATATATRVFQCDWLDRYGVRDLLLYGAGTRLYEYDSNLWARKAAIDPIGDAGFTAESALNKRALYTKAQVTVQYESVTGYEADGSAEGNVTGAALCEQTVTIDTQFLNLSGNLWWDAAKTKAVQEGQTPERQVKIKRYQVVLHGATTIPDAFTTLVGTTNVANYYMVEDVLNGGTKIGGTRTGNYLYEGFTLARSITGFGTAGWDVTLNFAEILNGASVAWNGWNKYYNPNTDEWSFVYDKTGTAQYFYPAADWTNLALPPIRVAGP